MQMLRYSLPLVLFISLVILFLSSLQNDPGKVPSPLIDRPAPEFTLPTLHRPGTTISKSDLLGEVSLINVWASWCVACRIEHPLLVETARTESVRLYGLNYKDEREPALRWLQQLGNPYLDSGFDADGRIGIDYGVYGVPETFVLDKQGYIRYKHIGPVDRRQLENVILPLVKELEQS